MPPPAPHSAPDAPATGAKEPPFTGKRIVLAFNPASGSFRPELLRQLQQALIDQGHGVRAENSRVFRFSPDDPVDLICAYGGDGTARTVVQMNGEAADGAAYCTYPSGTINLLAREAGYPANPKQFARLISARQSRPTHFGQIDGQAFLCCASVGPDAEVVARVSPKWKRRVGRLAYGLAALGMLWRWPRRKFRFTVDGAELEGEALFVCKGRYYAGPWMIDRQASLHKDSFQVLILPRAGRRDLIRLGLATMIHPALGSRQWHRQSARSIDIDGPEGIAVQADGDIIAATPSRIRLAPFFLNFL
ncbi:diacylglycerol/lipid kinase family protein [Novosphingobium umbonatum]|uniref:diacylglycerol/lipid kinase family protein n=1 Tax=Novosphingobium umbonatum TaxID=1908524 RepID=UPI0013E3C48C|nr:diacylglycerol kinase family protein [Novosphingobium umbonatum]